MAEPKSKLYGRAPQRRLLFVVVLAISVLAGGVSTEHSSLFSSSKPSTNSSGSTNNSGTAAPSATDAATTKAALFAAQQPSPIRGNTWVTPGSVPQGFQAGSSVELPGRDTATTTTFANPDGSLTTQAYGTAVNFIGADGAWHHIDPTLVQRPDGSVRNAGGPQDVQLAASLAGTKIVSVTDGPTVVAWAPPLMGLQPGTSEPSLVAAAPVAGAISGGTVITYRNAWSGIDLQYTSAIHSLTELLILHSAPTGSGDVVFRFPLIATGVTPQQNADGSLSYVTSTGTARFISPAGSMSDANINPASGNSPTTSVQYALGPAGAWVDIIASGSWLRDTARVYPVAIDPPLTFYGATDDAYVQSISPNSNFHAVYDHPPDSNGNCGQCDYTDWIGTYYDSSSNTGDNYTYLGYDVSALNGTRIVSAVWNGYFEWTSNCQASNYYLHLATSGWSSTGVTWNTPKPGGTGQKSGTVAANWFTNVCGANASRNWSSVDVTDWVQGWVSNPSSNNGLFVNENDQSQSGVTPYWKKIASNETTLYGKWSHVDITYEKFGPVNWGFADSAKNPPDFPQNGNPSFLGPTPNDTTPATMPVYVVNQGSSTWPANGTYRVSYHVYDATGTTLKAWDGARTYFTADVVPGSGVWVNASIAPLGSQGLPEGSYILRWDMVEDGVAWFSAYGGGTTDFRILAAVPPAPTTASSGGTSPANGSTLTTPTPPTLSASYCGTSNSPTLCHDYLFQLSTDQNFGGYITSSGWLTPAPNTPSSWQPPSTALQNGTTYYWRVMGRDQYSSSTGWSSPWSFTTAGLPPPPSNITATAGTLSSTTLISGPYVSVSWTPPPSDGGAAITSYDITPYLNWVQQPSVTVTAPLTSATVSGLVAGGYYTFTVAAHNSVGNGVPSDFSAEVVPGGVPGAPSGVTAIAGNNQVEVSWTPPADTTDVTGYQVTTYLVSPNGAVPEAILNVDGTATSATLTQGIVNGSSYTFGVVSVDNLGGGVVSDPGLLSIAANMDGNVTPSSATPNVTAISFDRSMYARGSSATVSMTASPSSSSGDPCTSASGPCDTVTFTLPPSFNRSAPFNAQGFRVSISPAGQSCGSGTVKCTIPPGTSQIQVTGLAVPSGGITVNATVRANGLDSACGTWPVIASVTGPAGTGTTQSASVAICDGGLGIQPWWSFGATTSLGPGGVAMVNPADGNLVVTQQDVPAFQLHGHLTLGLTRVYNSEEMSPPNGEPLGTGWATSWASAGDSLGGVGLRISSDEHVANGENVILISDSGARIGFSPGELATPINVTTLINSNSTGPLAPLIPTKLTSTGYTLCVNTAYATQMGVHANMWRYIDSTTGGCTGLNDTNAHVLGYATMTLDRVRREFDACGRLLSVRDALGNRVDYAYNSGGQLTTVGETGGSNRVFTLHYGTWSSGAEVDATDPAGRTTQYQQDSNGRLLNVINPDGTNIHYTYGSGCQGTANQLCSATDPNGRSTAILYGQTLPSWEPSGSPPWVRQLTDRSGISKTFSYGQNTSVNPSMTYTFTSFAGQRRNFTHIDLSGRVGVIGDADIAWHGLRTAVYTWDHLPNSVPPGTPTVLCRQPDVAPDNNLCAIQRSALNNGVTPDRITTYTYNDEGRILSESKALTPSTSIATTYGYSSSYVEANGTVRNFNDTIARSGQVTSGSTGRRDSATLFYYSDLAAGLTPNGNETLYTIDRNGAVGAGIPIASTALPLCAQGGANTGLVCQIDAPPLDVNNNRALTTYTYDSYGQRTSMTTPDMNLWADQPGAQPNAQPISYMYFQDGDRDLSGHTQAGGWLRTVIDPAGSFVAFGYDAAGNVVRTWERNATAGHTWTQFPGAVGAPPSSAYTETLYASGAAAYSAPWRFPVSSRDALGNVTTYQRDANGNPLGVRPPRGNQGGPPASPNCPSVGTFDVCSTYDASDRLLTVQPPVEAAESGSPHTVNTYDPRGNLASTTDPDGNVTTYGYDSVNRQVLMNWTMGPTGGAMQTPAGCRASTSTDAPIPANRILCSKTTIYDGVDNVTATTDGAVANDGTGSTVYTVYRYDAVHRLISTYTPRYDGNFRKLESDTVYDADGNATDICPPRQFIEGKQGCTFPNDYFSTHRYYNAADMPTLTESYLGYSATSGTPVDTSNYFYDADGNRIMMKDGNEHMTCNIYDARDRLITTLVPRNPANTCQSNYPFPSDGYNSIYYTYDPSGNRILTSQPIGTATRNTIVSYDADNRPVDTVLAAMTSAGQPATDLSQVGATDSSGGTNIHTRVSYDADGHAVARFSPRAFADPANSPNAEFMVRTDYDGDGRPTAQYVPRYDNSPGSQVSEIGVSAVWSAQASQQSDCPTGAAPATVAGVPPYPSTTGVCITRVRYDPASRVTQQLMPTAAGNWNSPRVYTFAYTDNGLVYQRGGPNPSSDSAAPVTATSQYDVSGNVVSSTDPAGSTTLQNWSRDHLLLSTQYPLGAGGLTHSQAATYDANGNQISSIDGTLASTITTYTTNNLRQSVATPSGGASLGGSPDYNPYLTGYTYDGVGNILTTSNPNASAGDADNAGRVPTTFTYTFDNLLATTVSPPGPGGAKREVDNTYDPADQRLTQQTFLQGGADGGILSYQYYLDGRLQKDTPRNTTPSTIAKTFTYNPDGNIISWQEAGTGTSSYYIDGSLRQTDDGGYKSQWSYDGAGRMATLATVRDADGQTATEAARYSNAGQTAELRTTSLNGGNSGETRNYDVLGRRTSITQSNGEVQTVAFNPDNTLASVTLNQGGAAGTQLSQWAYTYDRDYRITFASEMAAGFGGPSSYSYTYYPDGRLQQYAQSNAGNDTVISYDHDGNRTGWTPLLTASGAVTSTYNADDSLNQTSNNKGVTTVGYDPDGRMSSDTCTSYTYDGFDRMTQATPDTSSTRPAACGAAPSGTPTQTTYAYDALDRQGQHTDGTGWWWLHFANMGSEIAVLSVPATGAGEHDQVLTNDSSGTPSQVFDVQANVTQWFTNNGQGSVGDVTKLDGSNACVLLYDFYGTSTFGQSATNPCWGNGSQLTELGYHYGQRDSNTGDYTFGSRTYDPSKAAFATPDTFTPGSTQQDVSIGSDPLTEDRYSYVNGDPVNRIDPTGHHYDTGNDFADAQGSAYCAVCFTQPTQYVTRTSHGATCDASCRRAAVAERSRALAQDQASAAKRDATRPAACDGPHAGGYGCPAPGSGGPGVVPPDGGAPNMYTPSEASLQGYVGSGLYGACTYRDSGASLMCPDDSGNYTRTADEYLPHPNVDWLHVSFEGVMFILPYGKVVKGLMWLRDALRLGRAAADTAAGLSVDDAAAQAISHAGPGARWSVTSKGNPQLIGQPFTNATGGTQVNIGRMDMWDWTNPHLNLEVQIDGRPIPGLDPHYPIDPSTIP